MFNEIFYKSDDYYLSYNPACFDTGLPETALVIGDGSKIGGAKYFILMGDHREGFMPIAMDLEACKKYFLDRPSEKGFTSDELIVA